MTRFLLCSFALVLLYPSGIDMYLVGLAAYCSGPGGQRGAITYRLLGLSGRYGLRDAVCWPHRRPLGA